MDQSVSIHHWRYCDGWSDVPYVFLLDKTMPGEREFREELIGWSCWVYCNNHNQFMDWMAEHCPTADCTPRFNSGDPMVTIHITNKDEAAYFKLNFTV